MSFPLFFDEHVHIDLANLLVDDGHDVLTAARDAGRANQRINDEDQLQYATDHGRVLVTFNARDFVPIAASWAGQGRPYTGIVVCEQRVAWELYPRFKALFALYPDGYPPSLCMRLPNA